MRLRLPADAATRTLVTLYVPTAFISVGQGLVLPTIPALAAAFDVSPALAAQVVTAQVLGRAVITIPSGMLIDRLGRRPAMIAGPAAMAVGAAAVVLTTSFQLLLAAQFLYGAGIAIWQLGREVSAVDLIKPSVRGRVLSLFFGLQSAGQALGPVAGGLISERWGFRAVFGLAMVVALGILAMSMALPETGVKRASAPSRLFDFGRLRDLAGEYRLTYLVLMLATFAAGLRSAVINAMLPLYAGTTLGFSPSEVGGLFGIMGVVTLLLMGPAGWISDRIGRKAAAVPGALLSATAFFAYPFATTLAGLSAISVIVGAAGGFAVGSMTIYTYDISPERVRGRLQAQRRTMGEGGGVTGPAVAGAITSLSGPGQAFLFLAPLHLLSGLLLIVLARETSGRKARLAAAPSALGPAPDVG